MEKQLRRNVLMALGASGALLAIGAAAALWREKSGDGLESVDAGSQAKGDQSKGDTESKNFPDKESAHAVTVAA